MEEKPYQYTLVRKEFRYEFTSVSINKKVNKVVLISQTDNPIIFNVALLDTLKNGDLSDISVTNNDDFKNVLATIIQIIDSFLNEYPENYVIFRGSDEQRQRVYGYIIERELPKIIKKFKVFGVIEGKPIPFEKNQNYDFYLLKKI